MISELNFSNVLAFSLACRCLLLDVVPYFYPIHGPGHGTVVVVHQTQLRIQWRI